MISKLRLSARLRVCSSQVCSSLFLRNMATSAPPSTSTKPDLIAVIGTTGVGKSQLGVELAKSLVKRAAAPTAGEVLNHDSMQCYRGLDVITNKATPEEMEGVPHHLMGFLEPGEEWGVTDFQRDAIDKVRLSRSLSAALDPSQTRF